MSFLIATRLANVVAMVHNKGGNKLLSSFARIRGIYPTRLRGISGHYEGPLC